MSHPRKSLLAASAAVLVFATACSSSGGSQEEDEGASGSGAGTADTPRLKIAMVTHAPEGDAFFDVIRKGAEEAAAKDNVDLQYAGSGEIPEQAQLIQNVIDQGVDGLAVSLPDPTALSPVVQKAVEAGIPVITFNAGDRDWAKTGALSFYGEPEVLAGEFAGTKLNELGAKHALCVPQAQGQVQLEDRCAGLDSTFTGKSTKLYAEGTDTSAYVSTVSAKLLQDPSIDAVVTLGPALGVAMAEEVKKSGRDTIVASYAFNDELIPLLKDGSVAFTIDQQPYLQGYLSIDSLWLHARNRSVIGAQQAVATGPVVVDAENLGEIETYISDGLR